MRDTGVSLMSILPSILATGGKAGGRAQVGFFIAFSGEKKTLETLLSKSEQNCASVRHVFLHNSFPIRSAKFPMFFSEHTIKNPTCAPLPSPEARKSHVFLSLGGIWEKSDSRLACHEVKLYQSNLARVGDPRLLYMAKGSYLGCAQATELQINVYSTQNHIICLHVALFSILLLKNHSLLRLRWSTRKAIIQNSYGSITSII